MLRQALDGLKKLWAITGVLDQLVVCVQCRDVAREDACRVTCSCASATVKKRLGQCVYVYYCNKCFEGLRRKDGTLPPEWPTESEEE